MAKKKVFTVSTLTFGDLMELTEIQNALEKEEGQTMELTGKLFKFLDRVIDQGIRDVDIEEYGVLMETVSEAFNSKFSAVAGGEEKN